MTESQELNEAQHGFRAAMARLSAAVNVVTTDGPHGRAGLTVSAACSVTDSPPTMLVCINKASGSHDAVLANGRVCVNVLGTGQEELALRFAGGVPAADRFAAGDWDFGTRGVPVLRDALVSMVGRIAATHERGSHTIAFVEVETVAAREESGALVYFDRRFHPVG